MDDYKKDDRERGIVDGRACIFAAILPAIRTRAREVGYAIGLHGSMVRDLDLIAVPWTHEAVDADALATAIRDVLGGWFSESGKTHKWAIDGKDKPHGRKAYTLRMGGEPLLHVDLSVTPRTAPAKAAREGGARA